MEILMKNQWVENYVRQWKTYRSPLTESTRLLYFMSKIKILKINDLNKDVLCCKIITKYTYEMFDLIYTTKNVIIYFKSMLNIKI